MGQSSTLENLPVADNSALEPEPEAATREPIRGVAFHATVEQTKQDLTTLQRVAADVYVPEPEPEAVAALLHMPSDKIKQDLEISERRTSQSVAALQTSSQLK